MESSVQSVDRPPTRQRRMRLAAYILAPLLAFLSLAAWGLSSPPGATPDEDFHLVSIWCAGGTIDDVCAPGASAVERTVAVDLVNDAICYSGHPESSAACQGDDFGQNPDETESTDRGNFDGLYPPVFYSVMTHFASPDIETSVIVIRTVNAAFFVAVVTLLFFLLPERRRGTLLWGFLVTSVPLGMFLIPSLNPSSWAILSAGTLWLALLGFFETTGKRRIGLGVMAGVATLIGAGARADAAVYVGIAAVAVGILVFSRTRRFFLSALLPVALVVVAALFYLSSQQTEAASTGLSTGQGGSDWKGMFATNLVNIPGLWAGIFATPQWGLGWLDTRMPALVWVVGIFVFSAAVFVGLGHAYARKVIALVWAAGMALFIPAYILMRSQAEVGSYVQPRYVMPLLIIVVGIALLVTERTQFRLALPQQVIVVAGLAAANAVALFANTRRYVSGTSGGALIDADSPSAWWWDIVASPTAAWAIGAVAFTGLLVLSARSTMARRP
jgi:hypothetical protein